MRSSAARLALRGTPGRLAANLLAALEGLPRLGDQLGDLGSEAIEIAEAGIKCLEDEVVVDILVNVDKPVAQTGQVLEAGDEIPGQHTVLTQHGKGVSVVDRVAPALGGNHVISQIDTGLRG